MAEEFRVLRPVEYHTQLILKGQRVDGRSLEDVRELKIETDAIRTAESSSLVKLGNTSLVCGCTTQILGPNDKNSDNDEIKIKVELPPICSSPTGTRTHHTAQLLTKTLRNILDDSRCLDKNNFHIEDSDAYWSVDVEVICLNYDGCLLDAAIIAVLSALKTLKLTTSDSDVMSRFLEFYTIPICSSFSVIGNKIICDPNLEEESVASSTFSIAVDTKTKRCCNINKIGGKALSSSDLITCIGLAKRRAEKLKTIL